MSACSLFVGMISANRAVSRRAAASRRSGLASPLARMRHGQRRPTATTPPPPRNESTKRKPPSLPPSLRPSLPSCFPPSLPPSLSYPSLLPPMSSIPLPTIPSLPASCYSLVQRTCPPSAYLDPSAVPLFLGSACLVGVRRLPVADKEAWEGLDFVCICAGRGAGAEIGQELHASGEQFRKGLEALPRPSRRERRRPPWPPKADSASETDGQTAQHSAINGRWPPRGRWFVCRRAESPRVPPSQ